MVVSHWRLGSRRRSPSNTNVRFRPKADTRINIAKFSRPPTKPPALTSTASCAPSWCILWFQLQKLINKN